MARWTGRLLVGIVCFFILGCDKDASHNVRDVAYGETLKDLNQAIEAPPNVAALDRDALFTRLYHVPKLRAAKASLDDLRTGRRAEKLVMAFVKPAKDGASVFGLMWLQVDATRRTVVLTDRKEEVARFDIPSPDNPYLQYSTFIRMELFRLSEPASRKIDSEAPDSRPADGLDFFADKIAVHLYAGSTEKDQIEVAVLTAGDKTGEGPETDKGPNR